MEIWVLILAIFVLVQYVNHENLRKDHNKLAAAFNELNATNRFNYLESKVSPYLNGEIK